MSAFFSALLSELAARRRRLRQALGDRGQGLFEMLALGGVVAGSLGLLLAPWMMRAAPWGFAIPIALVGAYAWLDARRQAALRRGAKPERVQAFHDWFAVGLVLFSSAAGALAFAIAFSARPPAPAPPPEPVWQPPANAAPVDIVPPE